MRKILAMLCISVGTFSSIPVLAAPHIDLITSSAKQQIESKLADRLSSRCKGYSVGTMVNGNIVFVDSYKNHSNNTSYQWASVSKSLTGIIAWRLWERGTLDLGADIRKYDKGFGQYIPSQYDYLTTRHFLNHVSGYPEHRATNGRRDLRRINKKPGSTFKYSTGGFGFAADVLRSITGKTYKQLVTGEIANTLGNSVHSSSDGYDAGGWAIRSTIKELMEYQQGILNGTLIKANTLNTLLSGPGGSYKTGFVKESNNGRTILRHSGDNGTEKAYMYFDTDGNGVGLFCTATSTANDLQKGDATSVYAIITGSQICENPENCGKGGGGEKKKDDPVDDPVTGGEYYISPNGSNSNNGSTNAPWRTFQHALNRLKPGDTLFVKGGEYSSESYIGLDTGNSGTATAPITLKAVDGEVPVVSNTTFDFAGTSHYVFDGLTFTQSGNVIFMLGRHKVLSGHEKTLVSHDITFQNNTFRDSLYTAISISNGEDITVENNVFQNLRQGSAFSNTHETCGVNVRYRVDNLLIQGNLFSEIGSDGIHLGSQAYKDSYSGYIGKVVILNNEFVVPRDENGVYHGSFGNVGENGIDIKNSTGPVRVAGNKIHGFRKTVPGQDVSGASGEGMVIHDRSRNVTIEQNHIYDNVINIVVGGSATHPLHNIVIRNNILSDAKRTVQPGNFTGGFGIRVGYAQQVNITHNTLFNNYTHVRGWNVSDSVFKNNLVVGGNTVQDASAQFNSGYNIWSGINGNAPTGWSNPSLDLFPESVALTDDHRPMAGSVAIDNGTNAGVKEDFTGASRPVGNGYDIGAFEYGAVVHTDDDGVDNEDIPLHTIRNGGFAGTLEPWEIHYSSGSTGGTSGGETTAGMLTLSSSDTGSQDVGTLILRGNGTPVTVGQGGIRVLAGTKYRLTLALKGINVSHVYLNLRSPGGDGEAIGLDNHALPVSANSVWQPHEVFFTATKSTADSADGWFGIRADNDKVGQLYIDNVKLEVVAEDSAQQEETTVPEEEPTIAEEDGAENDGTAGGIDDGTSEESEADSQTEQFQDSGEDADQRGNLLQTREQWQQCKATCVGFAGVEKIRCLRDCLKGR